MNVAIAKPENLCVSSDSFDQSGRLGSRKGACRVPTLSQVFRPRRSFVFNDQTGPLRRGSLLDCQKAWKRGISYQDRGCERLEREMWLNFPALESGQPESGLLQTLAQRKLGSIRSRLREISTTPWGCYLSCSHHRSSL